MKKLFATFFIFSVAFFGGTADGAVQRNIPKDVSVRGNFRNNGSYVAPHHRSRPDGNQYNNYSSQPSYGGSIQQRKSMLDDGYNLNRPMNQKRPGW